MQYPYPVCVEVPTWLGYVPLYLHCITTKPRHVCTCSTAAPVKSEATLLTRPGFYLDYRYRILKFALTLSFRKFPMYLIKQGDKNIKERVTYVPCRMELIRKTKPRQYHEPCKRHSKLPVSIFEIESLFIFLFFFKYIYTVINKRLFAKRITAEYV